LHRPGRRAGQTERKNAQEASQVREFANPGAQCRRRRHWHKPRFSSQFHPNATLIQYVASTRFTADLEKLADWLQQCQIQAVAMEPTGVYWIPLFQILDKRKIEVRLVNAHHVKNVPGKKTDVEDWQLIQHLHACELLRGVSLPSRQAERSGS
jgi:hypothetical protein